MEDPWQLRVHPARTGAGAPVLVYLPGLHGDWTLVGPFRTALAGRATLAEFTYARTLDASLAEYARAVTSRLRAQGLERGWLLAESFGSQVAWAILAEAETGFAVEGVILAGGFVRYGQPGLARLGQRALRSVPAERLRRALRGYVWVVRGLRHRSKAFAADLEEFLARRSERDKLAAAHRLGLLAAADWRPLVRQLRLPVFHLAGFFDPIVPPWPVRHWLRRHCPGFGGARMIFASDHNVLSSAPRAAVAQVLAWTGAPPG